MGFKRGLRNDPRNHTKRHEILFVQFRVISWIVLAASIDLPLLTILPRQGTNRQSAIGNRQSLDRYLNSHFGPGPVALDRQGTTNLLRALTHAGKAKVAFPWPTFTLLIKPTPVVLHA